MPGVFIDDFNFFLSLKIKFKSSINTPGFPAAHHTTHMTKKMPVLDELKANIEKGLARIKHLEALVYNIVQERDKIVEDNLEVCEDNVKLQMEVIQWQDKWYKMKVALQAMRNRTTYPKRQSKRIKLSFESKKQK